MARMGQMGHASILHSVAGLHGRSQHLAFGPAARRR